MTTCTIETGLLRKKPCGHAAVAKCLNCDQPLCVEHAVAQLTEGGQRTGKFMCQECVVAAKDHAKSMAAVARSQEAKKAAALDKAAREVAAAPPAPKKPAAAPQAPAQPAAAEPPKEPEALEFTPKDGKLSYTKKKDEPGYKPD
ncbi:MAG TPA: hypothetical protein VIF38_02355 [Burkholderiales bacterium]|jgi:hypothetical protein